MATRYPQFHKVIHNLSMGISTRLIPIPEIGTVGLIRPAGEVLTVGQAQVRTRVGDYSGGRQYLYNGK